MITLTNHYYIHLIEYVNHLDSHCLTTLDIPAVVSISCRFLLSGFASSIPNEFWIQSCPSTRLVVTTATKPSLPCYWQVVDEETNSYLFKDMCVKANATTSTGIWIQHASPTFCADNHDMFYIHPSKLIENIS